MLSLKSRVEKGLEPRRGALYGKFTNRSQFIQYAARFALETAQYNQKTLEFTLDFIDALVKNPDPGYKLKLFLKEFCQVGSE